MQEQLPQKLHEIGEHGLGKHVLVFVADHKVDKGLPFSGNIQSNWKMHYLHVNLNEETTLTAKKMVNSLNYYFYADTLVFDFPAFMLFLSAIERTTIANEMIKRVIVFNPFAEDSTMMKKVSRYFLTKKYQNLLGKNVSFPRKLLSQFSKMFEKLPFLHANSVVIIGYEHKNAALKLAARIKNSRLETCNDFSEAASVVISEFN